MKALVRGQRVRLSDLASAPDWTLKLSVEGLPPSAVYLLCLCLDANDHVLGGQEVIHQGRKRSQCGGVELDAEGRFSINLPVVSANVSKILVAMGLLGQGPGGELESSLITHGSVSLAAGGQPVASFDFQGSDFSGERALSLLEFYRKDPWRLAVVGGGFRGGIPSLLSNYRADAGVTNNLARREAPRQVGSVPSPLSLPTHWPGRKQPAVPKDLLGAVGFVLVKDGDGNASSGTGFIISPGGLVLTCAHVVSDVVSGGIALGGSSELRTLDFIAADTGADIALLHINDRLGVTDWLLLEEASHENNLGDELGILGYPLTGDLGVDVSYCKGIINSLRKNDHASLLQIDAGAAPGSSGAPVFSLSTGKVLGILTSGLNLQRGGMHVNFAVDMATVRRLGWFAPR